MIFYARFVFLRLLWHKFEENFDKQYILPNQYLQQIIQRYSVLFCLVRFRSRPGKRGFPIGQDPENKDTKPDNFLKLNGSANDVLFELEYNE